METKIQIVSIYAIEFSLLLLFDSLLLSYMLHWWVWSEFNMMSLKCEVDVAVWRVVQSRASCVSKEIS